MRTSVDQEKLEPCPFHEKPAKFAPLIQPVIDLSTGSVHGYMVRCYWCTVHTAVYPEEEQAIHAWNCRPIEGALRKRMQEATEIVNQLNKHLQQEK